MLDINVDKLRKEFDGGKVVAVRDLTITFPAGTTTCLLGPSGCGKTTLMRIIAGLESSTSGDVYFGDERVTNYSTRKRNIGMVFQYPVVYRGINVRENIELPLKEMKLSKAERRQRVDEVVTLLEMEDAVNRDISTLDNGTRQKVAVARAVARQPRIILFDEPITNVDINAKLQLKRALKELFTRLNQTIIYVTHDQTEAMTLADKIALMRDGEIVQYDSPRELYSNPDDVFGGWFLGNPGMNFFEELFTNGAGENVPIFAQPATLAGSNGGASGITLGIRPEDIRVVPSQTPNAVRAEILNKSIIVGGQYLLSLQVGKERCKAKVPSALGRAAAEAVWVEFPVERIRLFGADGHQPDAELKLGVTPNTGSSKMITTRDPTLLLEIEKSKLLMQSLAMLDAIMLPEWQYRYYSFDAHWSENVQVGSMRNGCGDDFCAWFSPAGCFIKGFAHESLMTPYANKEHRIWPGLLDDVPLKFLPHLEESAFRMQDITLALWRSKEDSTWRSGEIEFPLGGFVGDKDPDGFIMLLELMDGLPQDYQYFAKEYCEEEISLSDVDHIYQHKPLTESIVKSLNPELSLSDVMDDAATIGYPTSG